MKNYLSFWTNFNTKKYEEVVESRKENIYSKDGTLSKEKQTLSEALENLEKEITKFGGEIRKGVSNMFKKTINQK